MYCMYLREWIHWIKGSSSKPSLATCHLCILTAPRDSEVFCSHKPPLSTPTDVDPPSIGQGDGWDLYNAHLPLIWAHSCARGYLIAIICTWEWMHRWRYTTLMNITLNTFSHRKCSTHKHMTLIDTIVFHCSPPTWKVFNYYLIRKSHCAICIPYYNYKHLL